MASNKRIAALHAILSADIAAYKSEMKAASTLTRSTEAEIKSSFASLSASTNASFDALQQKQRATFAAMRTNAAGLRSDTATAARGISAEIAAMGAGITKQLSAVNFGKALLSGFGVGSAIQILDLVGQKFVAIWKDAEIHAKAVEERAKSIHDVMGKISAVNLATVDARRTTEQRIAARKSEIDTLMAQMQAQDKRRSDALDNIRFAREQSTGAFGGLTRFKKTLQGEPVAEENNSTRAFSDMMAKRADEAQLAWSELALKLSEARKELEALNREQDQTLKGSKEKARLSGIALDFDTADAARKDLQKRVEEGNAIYMKGEEAKRAAAEKSRLAEIELDFDLADAKRKALQQQIEDGNKLYLEGEEKKRKITEDSAKRMQDIQSRMWENVADRTGQALTDAFFESEMKAKDLAASIARMIAEVALRMMIINPIMNTVFGLGGTANALPTFAGARADGGPVQAGKMYMVGEEGPEPFIPSSSGTIIPNHQLAAAGGGGTTVINADLRGASVDAVLRLEKYVRSIDATLERRAVGAVSNERRRGGGAGRTLGA